MVDGTEVHITRESDGQSASISLAEHDDKAWSMGGRASRLYLLVRNPKVTPSGKDKHEDIRTFSVLPATDASAAQWKTSKWQPTRPAPSSVCPACRSGCKRPGIST